MGDVLGIIEAKEINEVKPGEWFILSPNNPDGEHFLKTFGIIAFLGVWLNLKCDIIEPYKK